MPFLVTTFSSSYAGTQVKGSKQKKKESEHENEKEYILAVIFDRASSSYK